MFDVISKTKSKIEEAKNTSVYDCTLLDLPKLKTQGGHITPINNGGGIIPFEIKRVYYLYDIPGGEGRGAHAHKELEQLFVAVSGSFEIKVDDGTTKRTYSLSQPYYGLYLPPGLWRELDNFSSGATCLVLASSLYDEYDYIRKKDGYLKFKEIN
ncbi:WxcM-like domain-containing protein [Rhodohalobacter sp. SW132]|uniref:sugar 3,4-ketoisomerase n=1 Tax=Rhodohalobacter sp. SW132 TaxID=2293433 RepID=UPI000E238931|nr:FdtA/QdtA family cupin domain-containing protein [Rhodohalobacter sp. SW132]REL38640.1 WxcM-like domain-containing protein [Rhodohalobacter sp. SW132]